MRQKQKGRKKVQHELENDAEYKGLGNEKNVKCPNTGELISEKEYLRRFNEEWYYGTRQKPTGQKAYEIINTKEGQREAERNNNRNKRDVLSVAERTGTLRELTENEHEFMQDASDEWEWQDVYKYAGPEQAQHVIFEQAKRDIIAGKIDLDIILSRFAVKFMKLKTLRRRQRKQGKNK